MAGEQWARLGNLLRQRREELQRPQRANRAQFARDHGVSDRLLHDLEAGKRENYDQATYTQVEEMYGWERGSMQAVLDGGDPTLPTKNDVVFVGPGPTDALIFQRPPGIPDAAWDEQKARMAEDYAQWQAQLAAQATENGPKR